MALEYHAHLAELKAEKKPKGDVIEEWPDDGFSKMEFCLTVTLVFPYGMVAVFGEVEL
jgi:hypothetical protein